MKVDRRTLLVGAGAAAVSPLLPVQGFAAPPLSVAPSLPAFAVGTPGWHDWQVFFAENAKRAMQMWYAENGEQEPDASAGGSYLIEARDVPHLGFAHVESIHLPTVSDKIEMGWDENCSRCYCDVEVECDGYHDIGGEAVCSNCLTPQEQDAIDHDDFLHWFLNERYDATDPSVLALLRPEDLADDVIREVLAEEAALHPDCVALMPFAISVSGRQRT